MAYRLDKKDVAILWELYQNARIPVVKVAKNVGIPKETVKYRIEQLEKGGILKKYFAIVNAPILGLRFYETFIKLHGIPEEYLKGCIHKLTDYKHTAWLISTSGAFTLCCTFLVKNPAQFYEACYYVRKMFGKYLKRFNTNHSVDAQQFNYPYFKEFEELPPLKITKHEQEPVELDKINRGLLMLLTENCRMKRKEMAFRLKIAEHTVSSRIKWLEQKRFIQRYSILLHPGRAGYFFYILFVRVTLPSDELAAHIKNLPEIFYLKKKGVGFYDYKVELYAESESRVHEIEEELYRKFPNIVVEVEILHVKKEHAIRYFVDV